MVAYYSLDQPSFASAKKLAAAAIMAGSIFLSSQVLSSLCGTLRREPATEPAATAAVASQELCMAQGLLRHNALDRSQNSKSIVSNIWSGYIALSDSQNPEHAVTAVSGVWKAAKIPIGKNDSDSSQWVGIGGCVEGDNTLIQAGTASDCIMGTAVYYAWLETLPDYPVIAWKLDIHPNDTVAVSIKMLPDKLNEWKVDIKDVTTSGEFSRIVKYGSNQLSAEWVMERASRPHGSAYLTLPLGDFRTAYFGREFSGQSKFDDSVTINGQKGSITEFYHQRILMVYTDDNKTVVEAKPSKLYNGSSFRISRVRRSIYNPVGWFTKLVTIGIGTLAEGNAAAQVRQKPHQADER